jgi:hypothetical protein
MSQSVTSTPRITLRCSGMSQSLSVHTFNCNCPWLSSPIFHRDRAVTFQVHWENRLSIQHPTSNIQHQSYFRCGRSFPLEYSLRVPTIPFFADSSDGSVMLVASIGLLPLFCDWFILAFLPISSQPSSSQLRRLLMLVYVDRGLPAPDRWLLIHSVCLFV